MIMVLLKVTRLRLQQMTKFCNTQGTIMANDTVLCMLRKTLLMKVALSHKLMQLAPQKVVGGVMINKGAVWGW